MNGEADARTTFVREVFRSRCGREPSLEELEHYLGLLDQGYSREDVAKTIATRCALYQPKEPFPWKGILLIVALAVAAWFMSQARK